jgi:Mg/Co/Ni transporter MgtE
MVADVMTPEFISVDPATKLTRVLQLMVDHRMKSLPVLDADQRLVGIIAREDIMRALTESARGQVDSPAGAGARFSRSHPIGCTRLREDETKCTPWS